MRTRLRFIWLTLVTCIVATPAWALPLEQIIEKTKGSVAHISIQDRSGEEISSGSGFIVSTDRLVTNYHVIARAERAVAVFADDAQVEIVGVVASDPDVDVAVLQLASSGRPALTLSDRAAKQGDPVTVIGSPRGLSGTVSTGIVSALRDQGLPAEGADQAEPSWQLQITAALSPGSSGSPILDDSAEVVGLAVGVHRGGQALNFGIPIAHARRVLDNEGPVVPLASARARSVGMNLLISAVGIGGVLLLVWLVNRVLSRRKASRRASGA